MISAPSKRKGIGGHHRPYRGITNEWLTPPEIVRALGPFDLDPCSPVKRPWDTAAAHINENDDGLTAPWTGCVILNPPYGPDCHHWLRRLASHNDGIAIVFARTETEMFFESVWPKASAMLFIKGRLHFHRVDGSRAKANAGGPSVLIAYGDVCAKRLASCGIDGAFISLRGAK